MNDLAKAADPLRCRIGLVLIGIMAGCSGGPPHHDQSSTPVRITDVTMVAGEWEGFVTKSEDAIPSGSVRLTIRENGSYLFAGQTVSRVGVGAGMLHVEDGRLTGDSDRRAVSVSLYDHDGKAVLSVDSTNHETGDRYHGDFTRIP